MIDLDRITDTSIPADRAAFLQEWLPALPQARHIDPETAIAWAAQVIERDRARFGWHFKRLFGLGGSDAQALAAAQLGERDPFHSPHDIVDEKLMRRAPSEATSMMRRGVLYEAVTRRVFAEDFGARSRPDLIAAIQRSAPEDFPWMRGNPDDVVEIERVVWALDYKTGVIPSAAPTGYSAQVHYYDELLYQASGNRAHALGLVYFDFQAGAARLVPVEYSETIRDAMLEGGARTWEAVLEGGYPHFDYKPSPKMALTEDEQARLAVLEDRWLDLTLLKRAVEARLDETSGAVNGLLTRNGTRAVGRYKAPFQTLTGYLRRSVNGQDMARIVEARGLSEAEQDGLKKPTTATDHVATERAFVAMGGVPVPRTTWDPDAVTAWCDEQGIAPPIEESPVLSLRTGRKLPQETLDAGLASAQAIVDRTLDGFRSVEAPVSHSLGDGLHLDEIPQALPAAPGAP